MTSEKFQGISLDEQIQIVEDQSEFLAKKKKELNELKQLRDEIEIEVIKELEKKYDFKGFNENMSNFIEKFDDFLVSLNDYKWGIHLTPVLLTLSPTNYRFVWIRGC